MMPVFEYKCPQCELIFEELKGISGSQYARCPDCNHRAYKILSSFSFVMGHFARKDGEGFTSVAYRPDEYKERVRNNMSKHDT